nr:MAG TPA: hypothetical protein [Caudoviricetes sp.]
MQEDSSAFFGHLSLLVYLPKISSITHPKFRFVMREYTAIIRKIRTANFNSAFMISATAEPDGRLSFRI